MTEPEQNQTPGEEQKEPYVPSPVSRRIWAWMGVAYMVILMVLITYWIATSSFITGITGIMLFPLLGALSAQGFNNARLCKQGERGGNSKLLTATAAIMAVVAAVTLALGVVQLIGG